MIRRSRFRPHHDRRSSAVPQSGRWLLCGCLVLTLAGLASSTITAQTVLLTEQTLARIVVATPDAPPVDIYIDDRLIIGSAVAGSVTDYLPIETGKHTVQVVPAGGDLLRQVLVSVEMLFEPDVLQLLTVDNYLNAITVTAYPQDASALDGQGYARLRMIHLVPDANAFNLIASNGDELLDDILPLTASRYLDIQAGGQTVTLLRERQETVSPIPADLTLLPNVAYDLIVTGEARDDSIRIDLLATATDQPCGEFLALGGTESSCLRFVNASPEIPVVDLYAGEEPILVASGLAFGVVSPVISIPTGDIEAWIVPAGAAPDEELGSTSLFTEDGDGILLVGSGRGDRAVLEDYTDLRQPLAGHQARITVIHQANGAGMLDIRANETPVVQALLESEESAARLVPAGDYLFAATTNPDGQPVALGTSTALQAGMSYQIIIAGDVDQTVAIVIAGLPVPYSAREDGR